MWEKWKVHARDSHLTLILPAAYAQGGNTEPCAQAPPAHLSAVSCSLLVRLWEEFHRSDLSVMEVPAHSWSWHLPVPDQGPAHRAPQVWSRVGSRGGPAGRRGESGEGSRRWSHTPAAHGVQGRTWAQHLRQLGDHRVNKAG